MAIPFRREYVVYAHEARHVAAYPAPLPPGLDVEVLRPAAIDALFAADEVRRRTFHRLAAAGRPGIALRDGDAWVAYLWGATPATGRPAHLPAWLDDRYWLQNGHVRAEHRSRGVFKAMLREFARHLVAEGHAPEARLHGDIVVANHSSRQAFATMGFAPVGTMWTMQLPRLPWVWGAWDPDAPHPGVAARDPDARRCS